MKRDLISLNKKYYWFWKKSKFKYSFKKERLLLILSEFKIKKFYFFESVYSFNYFKSNKNLVWWAVKFFYFFNHFFLNIFKLTLLNNFNIIFKLYYTKKKYNLNFFYKNNYLL
jgi:hypothetical protein